MEETSLKLLRSHCCSCLSRDRKLFQLCRIVSGINNLYSLLSYDSEAFIEGFYKDSTSLFICWECKALMHRFSKFRRQVCMAQKSLSSIVERQDDKSSASLSKLSVHTNTSFTFIITSSKDNNEDGKELSDNFIDCGPTNLDIVKSEPEDDLPLSELNNDSYSGSSDTCLKEIKLNFDSQTSHLDKNITNYSTKTKASFKKNKSTGKTKKSSGRQKKYYISVELSEEEMRESRVQRKLAASYADSSYKCESCVEGFRRKFDYQKHTLSVHTEKDGYAPCDICHAHVPAPMFAEHRREHYRRYECRFCDYIAYTTADIVNHLKRGHSMKKVDLRTRGSRKAVPVKNPGSKPRRNAAMMDRPTPYGYRCTDCEKYFETKNQRWKHVQRAHRAGNTCADCGRSFAFSNNLARHRLVHSGPQPREECPVCRKQIRVDLMKAHARIHTQRQTHTCEECDKTFVSLASYEHHLKYSVAHSSQDLLTHKCSQCGKGYRSRGELRDHVNYRHKGTTLHKCPVCAKALASPRSITRHLRRVHEGVKDSPRDKICQLCGKAFRDKKGLREHERIHTGERPLSCSLCGATFRQSASLYTHKRRVHRIIPNTQTVEHTTES